MSELSDFEKSRFRENSLNIAMRYASTVKENENKFLSYDEILNIAENFSKFIVKNKQ